MTSTSCSQGSVQYVASRDGLQKRNRIRPKPAHGPPAEIWKGEKARRTEAMRRPARELRQDRSSGIPCSVNPNNRLSRCAFPRSCVTTWSAPEKYSPATTRSPYPRRRFANCCWNLPSTTTSTIAWEWPISGCAPRGLADHPAQMEAAPGSVARGMDLSGPMRTDRLRGARPGPGTAAPGILRAGAGGLPGGAPLAPGGQGGVGPLLLGKSGVAGRASLRQGQLDGDVVPQIVAG